MIMNIRKKALALGMISVMCMPAAAMQRSTARFLSAVVATGCAAGSYDMFSKMKGVNPVLLASVSGIFTYMTYSYLYGFTPEGRLSRAMELLYKVRNCRLTEQSFFDDRLFFDTLHGVYLTQDLPLVTAYSQLVIAESLCREAIDLLHKALGQVFEDGRLEEKCTDVLSDANRFLSNITQAVRRIKEHKDYLTQLQMYKEWAIAEKQAFAQEQMALAQLQMANAQTQIAHTQTSRTNLKWLKAIFG